MTRFFFTSLLFLAAIVLESLLRAAGLFLPLTAFLVFYVAVSAGFRAGIPAALIAGILLDLVFAQSAVSLIPFAFILLLAWYWRDGSEQESFWSLAIPCALLPVIYLSSLFLLRGGVYCFLHYLPHVFLATLLFAAFAPIFILLLDSWSDKLLLTSFSVSRENHRRGKDGE